MLYNNNRVEIELDLLLKSVLKRHLPYLIGGTITAIILDNVKIIRNSKEKWRVYFVKLV
jgi:hypothetical protein